MAAVVTDLVVEEVAGSLLGTVKQAFSYMWNSKENVENLRSEKNKLESMTKRVEQRINRATQNGDEILAGVEKWVEEALAHISTTEEFLQEEAHAKKTCLNLPMCVNPDTLRHYGKHATLKVTILETHQKNGAAFEGEISIPTASPGILELYPRENIEELGTHNSVLAKIIESVKGERTQITGIYGMGGVGKTTLATEVAARVKGVFAIVVFVTVSQPVDAASVKTQVENAAKRIDKGEKVLIILDDIWAEVKLHTIGIPCGTRYPSCKVLLTSRQRSVCTAMDAHTIISVECLPMKEAWVLFKRVVGKRVETDAKLEKVARKVVEGCGGLPLILQAVGKALKDKENVKEWEKALYSIQKHETSNISPSIRSEFAHLKLSYNFLESEEAKSIFLLCSMFPEDFNVSLERLTYYGVGLQLFKDLNSLEDARNKVQGAVEILKSSCLLLDGENEFTTKMHDVVREVALLIASKDDNKFLVEAGKNLTEWEPRIGSLESYTGISLMTNDICKLPTGYELNIPLLKIFLIQGNRRLSEVSDEFIQAMKEAKVIDFQYNNITSLPKSLNQLTRLSMLNLSENKSLRDVSILGELNQLEILILNGSGITEIPHEIGKLVNLRLLHAERCPGLSRIAQGVLSKLHWLEELSIEYQPVEERNYNSLFEIEKLKRLKTFFIQIGVEEAIGSTSCIPGNRILILKSPYLRISHLMHVRKLIEVCDGIVDGIGFECIMNLDNIMPMVWCEGFGLKNIFIQSCSCLSYLVDSRVLDEMQTFHTM